MPHPVLLRPSGPVSYTHLDVYKRQVLGRTEQQVTNLVYRGKQQLKQLLEQEGYQYENLSLIHI